MQNPNDAKLIYYRGLVSYDAKQFKDALSDFDKALALDPGLTEAAKLRDTLTADFVPASPSQVKPGP